MVIVRGADGRPRVERFKDVAAYRARLLSLHVGERFETASVSIDELAGLLDS